MSTITNVVISSVTVFCLTLSSYQSLPPAPAVPDPPEPSVEYDYSQPVPAGEQKGDDWFDNSAFIGHSLFEGFRSFSKVQADIHYFAITGISAKGVNTSSKFKLPNGGTGTLAKGLGQKDFSKVYIMLGINEISTSKDNFKKNMTSIIETVRATQPEGIPIYILEITPTTKKKSDATAYNRANIQRLNGVLAELCEEKECYLVDLWSCFADEDGYLPADKSTDGVHLKASQYRVMADYLLSHTAE